MILFSFFQNKKDNAYTPKYSGSYFPLLNFRKARTFSLLLLGNFLLKST